MTSQSKKISIISPFFNESEGISYFHTALLSLFTQLSDFDFEVICIDDGSTDGTLAQLMKLAAQDQRFIIVELSRNFGKEAALTAGMNQASGDAIIPMDGDLQDPPELIIKMVKKWQDGAEVVLARRIDRNVDSYFKQKSAQLFYRFHNQLSTIQIPENVGDFRLIDRVVAEALKQLPEQHRFMKGLFAWVGFKTVTIDYTRKKRSSGRSKFSGFKLWNFALEGITSFSATPLKFWSYLGGIGAISSLLYASFIVIRTLLYGIDVPGYASLLVAIMLFGSLQLISLGMLGEYIGRIYMESKHRPIYIIRKQYNQQNLKNSEPTQQ